MVDEPRGGEGGRDRGDSYVGGGVLVVRQMYMGSVLEVCEGDGEDVCPADDERHEEGAEEEVTEREEGGEDAHERSYLSRASAGFAAIHAS